MGKRKLRYKAKQTPKRRMCQLRSKKASKRSITPELAKQLAIELKSRYHQEMVEETDAIVPPTSEPSTSGRFGDQEKEKGATGTDELSLSIDGASKYSQNDVDQPEKVCGRRIVNILHLMNEICLFPHHEPVNCPNNAIKVMSEQRIGLQSIFKIRCNICNVTKEISTENNEMMNVKQSKLFGNFSTGGEYSQLEEICAALDVPVMTARDSCNDAG